MLGAVVPEMRAQADALAGDLAELLRVRQDIEAENTQLTGDLNVLAREQLRLNILVDERQQKQPPSSNRSMPKSSRRRTCRRKSTTSKTLLPSLNRISTRRHGKPATKPLDRGRRHPPGPRRVKGSGRMAPAVVFPATRGHLRLPVNGVRIREFGASDGVGGTQKGLSIAARAGADITAHATVGLFTPDRFAAMGNS